MQRSREIRKGLAVISGHDSDSSDKGCEEGKRRKEGGEGNRGLPHQGVWRLPQKQQEVIKHPKQENDVAKFIHRRSSLT